MPTTYLTSDVELTSIADAIRVKTGNNETLSFPTGFVTAIQSISTGSSTTPTIPLNTELVDYTTCSNEYIINKWGEPESQEWGCCTDYIEIDSTMTFTYHANYWYYLAFYTASHEWIRSVHISDISTQDQSGNYGDGTLSGSDIPSMARYIRLSAGYGANSSDEVSLIRTA